MQFLVCAHFHKQVRRLAFGKGLELHHKWFLNSTANVKHWLFKETLLISNLLSFLRHVVCCELPDFFLCPSRWTHLNKSSPAWKGLGAQGNGRDQRKLWHNAHTAWWVVGWGYIRSKNAPQNRGGLKWCLQGSFAFINREAVLTSFMSCKH